MAKRKKKGSRRRGRSRKKGYAKPAAKPLGAMAGVAGSGIEMLTDKTFYGSVSVAQGVVNWVKGTNSFQNVLDSVKAALKNTENYKWALMGVGVSAGKDLPVIRIVGKPVDRVVKRITKGRYGA